MKKRKTEVFFPNNVISPHSLRDIVKSNIEGKETSYYLFVSDWDQVSSKLLQDLEGDSKFPEDSTILNVINIFDIPDGLDIIRECIQEFRESISVAPIKTYSKIPMLVVLHKAFPRVVDYNGSIFVELGV